MAPEICFLGPFLCPPVSRGENLLFMMSILTLVLTQTRNRGGLFYYGRALGEACLPNPETHIAAPECDTTSPNAAIELPPLRRIY